MEIIVLSFVLTVKKNSLQHKPQYRVDTKANGWNKLNIQALFSESTTIIICQSKNSIWEHKNSLKKTLTPELSWIKYENIDGEKSLGLIWGVKIRIWKTKDYGTCSLKTTAPAVIWGTARFCHFLVSITPPTVRVTTW